MAAMERVDAPESITRAVFISAAISSLAAASFLLFSTLVKTDRNGVNVDFSTLRMLASGSSSGLVLLAMSLAMLWPAYLGLMSAVGMWQSRDRLQIAAGIMLIVLATIMVSSWRWIITAEANGDTWSVGCGLIGLATSLVAYLGFWRAGMWLVDSPYRE